MQLSGGNYEAPREIDREGPRKDPRKAPREGPRKDPRKAPREGGLERASGIGRDRGRDRSSAVLITGATSGIGFAAARHFLNQGALVIGIGRNAERCRRAQRRLAGTGPGEARFVTADLASISEVRRAAAEARSLLRRNRKPGLEVLINNAAAVPSRRMESPEGYELQLALGHLAPFLLTCELLPIIAASGDGRVITVSSSSHRSGRIHWRDPHLSGRYGPLRAYAQTKLANVLFTRELNLRLPEGAPVRAAAFDPGLVRTEIGHKHASGIAFAVWSLRRLAARPPEEASAWLWDLATQPREWLETGEYWKRGRPISPSRRAFDTEAARRLWELSEELCGCRFDFSLPVYSALY